MTFACTIISADVSTPEPVFNQSNILGEMLAVESAYHLLPVFLFGNSQVLFFLILATYPQNSSAFTS